MTCDGLEGQRSEVNFRYFVLCRRDNRDAEAEAVGGKRNGGKDRSGRQSRRGKRREGKIDKQSPHE